MISVKNELKSAGWKKGPIFLLAMFLSVNYCCMAMEIPFTKNPPRLDGNLSDEAWKTASKTKLSGVNNKTIENQTEVFALYDSENLYIAFKCHEKNMKQLKAKWCVAEAHDNEIWQDDCVEIFLNPMAGGNFYNHIIINSAGLVYDAAQRDASWESELKCAISKQSDFWIVEASIPFRSLGYSPKGGERWLGNFGREEKPSDELSSLFPTDAFSDVKSFGEIRFMNQDGNASFLGVESLNDQGNNTLKLSFMNKSGTEKKITVNVKCDVNGKEIFSGSQDGVCKNNSNEVISIPYKIESVSPILNLRVSNKIDNSLIYENKFVINSTLAAKKRIWEVKNPLYSELLSDEKPGIAKEGALCWFHGIDYVKMRVFAQQYAVPYSYKEMYRIFSENKMFCFMNPSVLSSPNYKAPQCCAESGMKITLFPDERGASTVKMGKGNNGRFVGRPFLFDPAAIEKYLSTLNESLKNHSDTIWAVGLGDEIDDAECQIGIELFSSMKNEYPYIMEANEEVKAKYGYGKYGIPESLTDTNPFRWIAYSRWINEKLSALQKQIYEITKKHNPAIYVVSDDPVSKLNALDYSSWNNYCDIMTHQLYPTQNQEQARFGFLTKLVKDLSGTKEFWPCPHVENYAASFSQEEVLELLSQVFRNGGDGLHYYLSDSRGKQAGKNYLHTEYYGAPERWQLEMNVAREIGKMNKVKFPEPDFAVFYSSDSIASIPVCDHSMIFEVENAYLMLGPKTGGWFKFINDFQLERNEVDMSKFKAVYVPFAKYERIEAVRKLADYAEQGGTLVICDPEAFSFNTDGERMPELAGTLGTEPDSGKVQEKFIAWQQMELPVSSTAIFNKKNSEMESLCSFKDGKPAVTVKKYGKGKIVRFAANPFTGKSKFDERWVKFFSWFQGTYVGVKLEHDIWRFKLPSSLMVNLQPPQERCLTGNYIFWKGFMPLDKCNINTSGTYCYSTPPDKIKDVTDSGKISFETGKLTNRRKVIGAGNVDSGHGKIDDWIVRWNDCKPFQIVFDFTNVYDISAVNLFYTGELPEVNFSGSSDGQSWEKIPLAISPKPFTEDVIDCKLQGNFGKWRFIKTEFGQRKNGKYFSISEFEIWSK